MTTTTASVTAANLAATTGIEYHLALAQVNLGALGPNSAWFLKSAWRQPYTNESLYYSQ